MLEDLKNETDAEDAIHKNSRGASVFEKISGYVGSLLLAGAMAVSGCSVYHPIKRSEEYFKPQPKYVIAPPVHNSDSIYTEIGVRAGVDIARTDVRLSKEKRTVPVHPADAKGSSGRGVVMGSESYSIRPHLGLEWSIGRDDLRFKLGGDAKVDFFEHDQKLQALPSGYESYGYNDTKSYTLTPFVGFDAELYDKIGLGLEFGLPFNKGEYEIGHYRWDSKEPIARYPWRTFGKSINIRLGDKLKGDHKDFWGFVYGIEKYDTELGGEKTDIESHSISFVIELGF